MSQSESAQSGKEQSKKVQPGKRVEQVLQRVPGNPLVGLRRADALWGRYKAGPREVKTVVGDRAESLRSVEFDVAICGGTLGILLGAALAQKGWNVVLLERGVLKGRDQEWNISRRELETFVQMGLLSEAELEEAIASQYNPARITFSDKKGGGKEIWVKDVLNIGVDPVYLLETLKQKFLSNGGILKENTPFKSATVHPNGVAIETGNDEPITARLLVKRNNFHGCSGFR